MAKYRITAPGGSKFDITAPDDATPEQVQAFAEQQFASMQKPAAATAPAPVAAPQPAEPQDTRPAALRFLGDAAAGAVRGAGSIGATILTPLDAAARALGIQNDFIGRTDRRDAMTGGLRDLGFDTDSLAFGAGKIGGEIAGTMGVGGALANMAARLPGVAVAAPRVLDAVRTAGMSAGGATGAKGALLRAAGGAITGGASAAAVNPEDAAMGAGVGAVMPGVLQAAGRGGQIVGGGARRIFASARERAGEDLVRALDLADPQAATAAAQQLRSAAELVPGSRPTLAQALPTPQAGILQRVVHDSPGGSVVRDTLAAQNAARLAALEGVAPTVPGGYAAARQDTGEAVARFAQSARDAAKAKTSAAYQAVPQDEAVLYLPDLAAVRDKFFGRGVFTGREGVDQAVRTAQEIGTQRLSPVAASRGPKQAGLSLAQAVRRAGGIAPSGDAGVGELGGLVVMRKGGLSPAHMAEKMREAGYLRTDDTNELLDALRAELHGRRAVSDFEAGGRAWQAARDAAMGPPPGAEDIPAKVTLREFDNLRKSIGQIQRAAQRDPARATEAKALGEMKKALDDRINEVVRGDGAADEVLPIAWADALDEARRLKLAEVERFMTGPQAALFRTGADGQPLVQGGEVVAKFWGNRPGLADDVDAFRRLIADNPRLLGQFRSMVTTEGAGTADAGGKLGAKFARWVENMMPGIQRTFDAQEVDVLRRLAMDIKRSEAAAAAGMSRGSNTYQNAANALSLGVLDSPAVTAMAQRVPFGGGTAVNWLREAARNQKARRMGEVVSDAQIAAEALEALARRQQPGAVSRALGDPAVQALFYRAGPVLAADR